jgi:hypothetical protein
MQNGNCGAAEFTNSGNAGGGGSDGGASGGSSSPYASGHRRARWRRAAPLT